MSNAALKIEREDEQEHSMESVVGGIHCISCARRIENKLQEYPEVVHARVNMTSRHLTLVWQGDEEKGQELNEAVKSLGFDVKPYVPDALEVSTKQEARSLMKAMAVAGFAMGNIMLLSFAVWSNTDGQMGEATQRFFHWLSALIAVPSIAYAGRPFFSSAFKALSNKQTNMDVPISLAMLLATGLSLFEIITHSSRDVYFDSAVMLMFFLLVGRYLNVQARGRAKSAAQDLLMLMTGEATCLENGKQKIIAYKDITEGMVLLVAAGETVPADAVVQEGRSDLDTSLLTGETLPRNIDVKGEVLAGMVNLTAPLTLRVTKPNSQSCFHDIIRLMEKAEQGSAKYIRLSDKIAKLYTPLVHSLSLLTFLLWYFALGAEFHQAVIYAISVLIITCPCALGLAIPVVQVLASGRLFKKGILIKTGDALEKLSQATSAFFDKTGTLTYGRLNLLDSEDVPEETFKIAASMAAQSKHPLSRAISSVYEGELLNVQVEDLPGCGLETEYDGSVYRLGKESWAVDGNVETLEHRNISLCLSKNGDAHYRFTFQDVLREDSPATIERFQAQGLPTHLVSGDRKEIVEDVAKALHIDHAHAEVLPDQKCHLIEKETKAGQKVLMVGDGLNDAPALTTAHVSISPATAMGITQNAADIVFQGDKLNSVYEAYETARVTNKLTKTNLALAALYNMFAIPLAVTGFVTPMIAAIAMSSSSIIVILNSLRLNKMVAKRMGEK